MYNYYKPRYMKATLPPEENKKQVHKCPQLHLLIKSLLLSPSFQRHFMPPAFIICGLHLMEAPIHLAFMIAMCHIHYLNWV